MPPETLIRHDFYCLLFFESPKSKYMSDNKAIRDKRDSSKIDLFDPSEVEYVHQQFPNLLHSQIVDAIREKGPSREEVMKYLETKGGKN